MNRAHFDNDCVNFQRVNRLISSGSSHLATSHELWLKTNDKTKFNADRAILEIFNLILMLKNLEFVLH